MAKLQEAQSEELLRYLRSLVRRRWPTLDEKHEDWVSESMADTVEWASDKSAPTDEDLRRVATTILRRRVADHFREHVHRFASAAAPESLAAPAEVAPRLLALTRVLRTTLEFIASLEDPADRALLLEEHVENAAALTAAMRKRRERLRARLRDFIVARLGPDADGVLKE